MQAMWFKEDMSCNKYEILVQPNCFRVYHLEWKELSELTTWQSMPYGYWTSIVNFVFIIDINLKPKLMKKLGFYIFFRIAQFCSPYGPLVTFVTRGKNDKIIGIKFWNFSRAFYSLWRPFVWIFIKIGQLKRPWPLMD